MLNHRGILAAVELAFFAPAGVLAVLIVIRHGRAKKLGWYYVLSLSLLRIVSSGCSIYSQEKKDYSNGLLTAIAITNAIGTTPILLALLGFLERIHDSMDQKAFTLLVFRPLHLGALLALILAIVGGSDEGSTKPGEYHTGRTTLEAAAFIYLVLYLALAAVALYTTINVRHVVRSENPLLRSAVLALPFILVRIIYTIGVSIAHKGSPFYFLDVNLWIQALMKFLMEFIIVCLYLYAGFATPPTEPKVGSLMGGKRSAPPARPHGVKYEADAETGTVEPDLTRRERRQERRDAPKDGALGLGLKQYRPSHVIRDAIASRR